MKINQLDISNISNSAVGDLAIFQMFASASIVVKIVILSLLFISIASWAVIFDKFWFFLKSNKNIEDFEKKFHKNNNVKDFHHMFSMGHESILASIFNDGFKVLDAHINNSTGLKNKSELVIKEAFNAMQNAADREIGNMEKNLSLLATAASVSPFIGLFGTVWGIMTSFQAIVNAKNTSIAVVAPGIAEALLVTAIGLLVAIPALIFYNKFSTNISKFSSKIDCFVETASIKFEKYM